MDGMVDITLEASRYGQASCAGRPFAFPAVIDDICGLPWQTLDSDEVMAVAKAYYYFSIQFRENLEIACRLHPTDAKLQELREGECATDNLSPWPGVTAPGEKLDHDEFMRRLLAFDAIDRNEYLTTIGQAYLARTRELDDLARATSIASYEDGGLTRVFEAILRAPVWHGAAADAFKFFLEEHIRFDSDDNGGHGALARHLTPDDRVLPLWVAFRELLLAAVPRLWQAPTRRLTNAERAALMPLAAD